MLSITRSTARLARAVFRKAPDARVKPAAVLIDADRSGLRLQTQAGDVAVEYRIDGRFEPERFAIPFDLLAAVEGANDSPVQLFDDGENLRVEWSDAGVPQRRVFAKPKAEPTPLDPPASMPTIDGKFLRDFHDAVLCSADSSVRFALNRIQLRGAAKEIVGTDGRQLLIIRGIKFPWNDDLLVPRTKLFGDKRFAEAESVELGRTEKHVVVRVGPWTVWLTIDTAARFPDVARIIPQDAGDDTRILLDPGDSEFLAKSLPRLPSDEDHRSVTVHLNGKAAVRAKAESSPVTELILSRSRIIGGEVRINTDPDYLRRAAEIGVDTVRFRNDQTPIVAESPTRTFVWQPLVSKQTLGPADDAVRIVSDAEALTRPTHSKSPTKRPRRTMPDKNTTPLNDVSHVETTEEAPLDPLQEAETLHQRLRQTLIQVHRLISVLKRQRKQAQLVRSTLASLKQLQDVA